MYVFIIYLFIYFRLLFNYLCRSEGHVVVFDQNTIRFYIIYFINYYIFIDSVNFMYKSIFP